MFFAPSLLAVQSPMADSFRLHIYTNTWITLR